MVNVKQDGDIAENQLNGATAAGGSRAQRTVRLLLITAGLTFGLWAVTRLTSAAGTILSEMKKVTAVMTLISNSYVERPDLERLTEGAIEGMLERLDPHSVYIPPVEQKRIAEQDYGEFEGIGISFVIQNELITVVAPIVGTPAERLGIRSGDRIIEIDGVSAFGITYDEVFQKLRGPRGTAVRIKVAREGVAEPFDFTIIRDKIPIYSILTKLTLDDSTGYVLINQFTATTSSELSDALKELERAGMTRLILDLRNNQGGRLNEAVSVADMFIPGGHVIVSRRGRRADDDTTYYSTDATTHPLFALVVLINGGSASASEIVAGAVQDLDRGLVVGQNSFGKGLVQYPYPLGNGGVIRLSTAYWFTPSGRLVQRPYDKGRGEYYALRYRDPDSVGEGGEREAFRTLGGRTVYASSGVTPDVQVEERRITAATARLLSARLLFDYAQELVSSHHLVRDGDFELFRRAFTVSDEDLRGLAEAAAEEGLEFPAEALQRDRDYLASQLKAEMAQILWSNRDCYYIIRSEADQVVQEARGLFDEARHVSGVWYEATKG